MNKPKIYCLCLDDDLLNKVKKINYLPVGLGNKNFQYSWLRDNSKKNISIKNKFYGEYSFHYWLWKNSINEYTENQWVGFCTYRRLWLNNKNDNLSQKPFKDKILHSIPKEWGSYQVILPEKIRVDQIRLLKILKYGKIALIKNPRSFFKRGRNIKFQFDMFHGNGVLDKAINVLNHNDREDFRNYVNDNRSFNPFNMFICRSKTLTNQYYETVFEWLSNCEKIFGFNLKGYNRIRLYAFLAERFMPFWFNKYAKCLEWPIIFQDLRKINY
jgi:hypothetical protein